MPARGTVHHDDGGETVSITATGSRHCGQTRPVRLGGSFDAVYISARTTSPTWQVGFFERRFLGVAFPFPLIVIGAFLVMAGFVLMALNPFEDFSDARFPFFVLVLGIRRTAADRREL